MSESKLQTSFSMAEINSKDLIIGPEKDRELLIALGLINTDGRMKKRDIKKLFQINHFIRLIEGFLEDLFKRHNHIKIVDLACGNAYLSLALAVWIRRQYSDKTFSFLLCDNNEALIKNCQSKISNLNLSSSVTVVCDTAFSYLEKQKRLKERVHLTLALHACDTLSDYALASAYVQNADYFAIAPCCQAELSRQWKELPSTLKNETTMSLWLQNPHLRRESAALVTDSIRVLAMRSVGYEVNPTEFVSFQHSAKNRLLLGIKRGRFHKASQAELKSFSSFFQGNQQQLLLQLKELEK